MTQAIERTEQPPAEQKPAAEIAVLLHSREMAAEALAEEIKELREQLAAALVAEGLKEIITESGQGYKRQVRTSTSFGLGAYEYLRQNPELEDLFRAEPKITISALESLKRDCKIALEHYNELCKFKETDSSGAVSIASFKPKFTKADADRITQKAKVQTF
jgi:hypothetical protein